MQDFIGRHEKISLLKELLANKKANLVVIRGRRRIGKSRLTQEFGKYFKQSYYFSGLAPRAEIRASDQRNEFVRQMREQQIPGSAADDWGDLLYDLAAFCKSGQVLVVLDEITWMSEGDPTFLAKLKNTWDMHFKNNTKLTLILSGSDSAWIEDNILSKTGFFGRISIRMKLAGVSHFKVLARSQYHPNTV